jgi:2-polyprenyl-6-methoxyphenol hydroxylase-like FAD-dependent oxidoreductase
MANNTVLIVGAWPTGMTAAIELKRLGTDVRIIDKSDYIARYSQSRNSGSGAGAISKIWACGSG